MQFIFFFFNDTATTEIYTLSLHDALPIYRRCPSCRRGGTGSTGPTWWATRAGPVGSGRWCWATFPGGTAGVCRRSEEHTSELQSRQYLVCRLLLEKKNNKHQQLSYQHLNH